MGSWQALGLLKELSSWAGCIFPSRPTRSELALQARCWRMAGRYSILRRDEAPSFSTSWLCGRPNLRRLKILVFQQNSYPVAL